MISVASCVLASTLTVSATPPEPLSRGELAVRMVEHHGRASNRRRLRRGVLTSAFSVVQLGLGVYGLASPRFTPVMRRTAVAQTLFGLAGVSLGAYDLIRPSALERLASSLEYEALRAEPDDPDALNRLEVRWARQARSARTWRYVMGGGYVLGGVGLSTYGVVTYFSQSEPRSSMETFWVYGTLSAGLGLILTGALELVSRGPFERSYDLYRASTGRSPSERRRPTRASSPRRARLSLTAGGVVVSGQF